MPSPINDAPGRAAGRRGRLRDPRSDRRAGRTIKVPRGWATPRAGRAWINGREVGGVDPRYVHLSDWLD